MKTIIHPEILERFSHYSGVVLYAKNLSNRASDELNFWFLEILLKSLMCCREFLLKLNATFRNFSHVNFFLTDSQPVIRFQIQPKLGWRVKSSAQLERGFWCNAFFGMNNFVNHLLRTTHNCGKFGLRPTSSFQFAFNNSSWWDQSRWSYSSSH